MPASSACTVFLVDIFKVVGLLAERPLRFRHLGAGIGEAALIPLTLSRRVSELTGIPLGPLTEAVYRLGQGRGLAGDLPAHLAEEQGWSHADLTHLGAQLRELDRDGTTARIWQELCRRWPIVQSCYREAFPCVGEAAANPRTPAGEQISLRGRVAAFMTDRARELGRLPTLDEVYQAFPHDGLGSRSTFYRRNRWYIDLREAIQRTIQREPPRRGHRAPSDDGGPGQPDAWTDAPDYYPDED
jgi:hypothetical protein